MKRFGCTTLVLLGLVTLVLAGCVRIDEGVAIRNEDLATPRSMRPQPTPTPSTDDAGPAAPGILATTRAPIPVDSAVKISGPDGMFATVTITRTKLDPAAAFTEYADKAMAVSAVSSISVLPAELCGYSGQKLMGAWSDTPQRSVEFEDRIVHIWTDTSDYLVAIHVQAPAGTNGFDAASTVLTEDFTVEIP